MSGGWYTLVQLKEQLSKVLVFSRGRDGNQPRCLQKQRQNQETQKKRSKNCCTILQRTQRMNLWIHRQWSEWRISALTHWFSARSKGDWTLEFNMLVDGEEWTRFSSYAVKKQFITGKRLETIKDMREIALHDMLLNTWSSKQYSLIRPTVSYCSG